MATAVAGAKAIYQDEHNDCAPHEWGLFGELVSAALQMTS